MIVRHHGLKSRGVSERLQKVGFKLTGDSVSLSTDKNKPKDITSVEKIKESKISIETREGLDVSVKDVSDHSDVKIK